MYTKEQLKEKLENNNLFLDMEAICGYLKSWRIDPVYEDNDQTEFFDELAISKLSQGVNLLDQGKTDEEILSTIHNGIINPINAPAVRQTSVQSHDSYGSGGELKKITVDITTQTLALLAESIAHKISNDIATKVKEADLFKPVMNSGKLTRDNEILSKQVEKLLDENKKLISRINFLQQENAKFKHVVGSLYIKQE